VLARVGGLAALLAAVVGGGTLLTGAAAIVGALRTSLVVATVQSTFASLVFALAFAVVTAPLAIAALGARTRLSGYFALLLVLVLPEVAATTLAGPLPSEVTELCALPSALAALRASLAPGTVDLSRCLRAVVALTVFLVAALLFLRREALALEHEEGDTS
jgi:hypothetical protein